METMETPLDPPLAADFHVAFRHNFWCFSNFCCCLMQLMMPWRQIPLLDDAEVPFVYTLLSLLASSHSILGCVLSCNHYFFYLSVRDSNNVPPLLPALCLGTLCRDKIVRVDAAISLMCC